MKPELSFVALAILICFANLGWGNEREPIRPNIVYILLDDAGYGDLSCYGQEKFETPNIDELCKRGLKFTQHYAGSTVCAPTRSVLMTGMHTGHTFVRGNREVRPEGQIALPKSTITVAELLSKSGYQCGGFGKWGLGSPGSEGDPVHQGFHKFFGYNCQREAHTYYPTHLWNNLEKVKLDGTTYAHDVIMEQALGFIESNKDKPFFCFLPVTIPHAAMHVPAKYSDPFRKKFPQFEDKIGKYRGPKVQNPVAAFAGMMTKMDEDVGRIIELLDRLEIRDNTIVMLSSDNGPHKEGGHDPLFFNSNGPFRGLKRDLYEGGIRVPMIANWPGKISAGTSDHISAHWDILPTLCELAGVDTPKTDGISLVPTLIGEGVQPKHEYLYWEFYERGGRKALRMGDWKAVQYNVRKNRQAPIQLFDLNQDPGEQTNVAEANPSIVARAKELMEKAHEPSEVWSFAASKKKTPKNNVPKKINAN